MRKRHVKALLSFVLALAMVVTSLQTAPIVAQAKAKKATLKTKKMSVNVGASKKISIKNKKSTRKYTFKSANKKVATVSKAGKVKGIKAGKVKITVKETVKKTKKVRTLGKVTVTVKKAKAEKPSTSTSPSTTPSTTASTSPSVAPSASTAPSTAPSVAPSVAPSTAPSTAPSVAPSVAPSTNPSTAPSDGTVVDAETNEKYCEFVTANSPGYDAAEGGIVYTKTADTEAYAVISTVSIPANVEAGFTKIAIEADCYGNGGRVLHYSIAKRQWAGPFTANIVNSTDATKFVEVNQGNGGQNTEGLWNAIYDGTTVLSLKAGTCDADYSDGTGHVRLEFKDMDYLEKIVIRSVRFTGYEGYSTPEDTDHSVDNCEDDGEPAVDPTETEYSDMVSASTMSTGNNARLKAAIAKAKAGEDVTLAYIGGSITEGEGGSPRDTKCYAYRSYELFKEAYKGNGDGSNIHFVNAGMCGTPSSLGIIRYQRDVMDHAYSQPDIVMIEFSVNDSGECTGGQAYESMIRDVLETGAAVVLNFAVFKSDWNMQAAYRAYGDLYELPMVSIKDAIDANDGAYLSNMKKWFFADELHPNNKGHQLMADCIAKLYADIDAEDADTDERVIDDIEPLSGDSYQGIQMLDSTYNPETSVSHSAISNFSVGGFTAKDTDTGEFFFTNEDETAPLAKFPDNWQHTATSGADSLTFDVNCSSMMVVYKLANDETYGTAEVLVDGVVKATMTAYDTSGWNNATTALVFENKNAESHHVEIRMKAGNENKKFTLFGLGYVAANAKWGKTEEEADPEGSYAIVPTIDQAHTQWGMNFTANPAGGVKGVCAQQWQQGNIQIPDTLDLTQYATMRIVCDVQVGECAFTLRDVAFDVADDSGSANVLSAYNKTGTTDITLTPATVAELTQKSVGVLAQSADGAQVTIKKILFLKAE